MCWKLWLNTLSAITLCSLCFGLSDAPLSPYGRQNFDSPAPYSSAIPPMDTSTPTASPYYQPLAPPPAPFSPNNINRPLNSSNPYDPSTPYIPLYPYGTFPQKTSP